MKYQIVPVEPTEAQYKAADSREWDGRTSIRQKGVYQAMLQASPIAPNVEEIKEILRWLIDVIEIYVPSKEPLSYAQESVNKAKEMLKQFVLMEKQERVMEIKTCPFCGCVMQHEDKEMFGHAVAHPTTGCILSMAMNNQPNRWFALDEWNRRAEPAGLLSEEYLVIPRTVIAEQAERRDELLKAPVGSEAHTGAKYINQFLADIAQSEVTTTEAALANTEPSVHLSPEERRVMNEALKDSVKIVSSGRLIKEPSVPVSRVEHWLEYWNKDCNEGAMRDALYYLMDEFTDAIIEARSHE